MGLKIVYDRDNITIDRDLYMELRNKAVAKIKRTVWNPDSISKIRITDIVITGDGFDSADVKYEIYFKPRINRGTVPVSYNKAKADLRSLERDWR